MAAYVRAGATANGRSQHMIVVERVDPYAGRRARR